MVEPAIHDEKFAVLDKQKKPFVGFDLQIWCW